jgi:UDP-2,3-diacylglucosamine hydrolase
VLPRVLTAFRGGDDHLLSGVGRILEAQGFRMVGIRDVAPDLLMPEGPITRASPTASASADIARGRDVLGALGPFDIGQAAVVIDGHVVAVEDIEGTDGLLARVARLREAGRIRAKPGRGVLVKAPKSRQDLRFDLPTIGSKTVEGAAEAKLAGIAVIAGNTIAADAQAMIEIADRAGLFIQGLAQEGLAQEGLAQQGLAQQGLAQEGKPA